jgi:hypothetical protein
MAENVDYTLSTQCNFIKQIVMLFFLICSHPERVENFLV